jgi:hypothetical protein
MRVKDFRGGLFPVTGRPRAIEPKESFISKSIQHWLDVHRVYNDRLNSGKVEVVKRFKDRVTGTWRERRNWLQLCKKGTADRFFLLGGRIYFVEVKMRGQVPTPEQLQWHDAMRRAHCKVIVADSLQSFIGQFKEILK